MKSDETITRSVKDYNNISVGDSVEYTRTVENEDVFEFARISGDTNPLHLDYTYASESQFERRIVHGSLVQSFISACLAHFPGIAVYLSQDSSFLKPVDIGETVTARCELIERLDDDMYRVDTTVSTPEKGNVIEGEAVIQLNEPN